MGRAFERGMREIHGEVEFVQVSELRPTQRATPFDQLRQGVLTFGVMMTALVVLGIAAIVILATTIVVYAVGCAFTGVVGGVILAAIWFIVCVTVTSAGLFGRAC